MKKFIKNNSVFLLILGIFVVFFYPYLAGKVDLRTGMIYNDLWLFNFPLKDFYKDLLSRGELPFWTSYIGNGYPLFAEGQIGALYPINFVLFRLLPVVTAYNLNIIFHSALAFSFTYLFARKTLNLTKRASFLSAFLYPFSGYYLLHTFQINIIIVVSYTPAALYCADRLSRGKLRYIFTLALVLALQILAGHIEMFYYSTVLVFAFFLLNGDYTSEKAGFKKLALGTSGFIVAGLLAVGISSAQILSTYELNQYSSRSQGVDVEEAQASRWPIKSLLLFFNPRYIPIYHLDEDYSGVTVEDAPTTDVYAYIGFISILLAMGSVILNRKKYSVIFSILLLITFTYAFGRSTQIFTLVWETLPGLKFFRYPTKIAFFIVFTLSVLSGMGYDYFAQRVRDRFKGSKTFYLFTIGVLAIIIVDVSIFNIYGTRKLVDAKWWLEKPEIVNLLEDKITLPYTQRLYSHGTNNLDFKWARDSEVQKSLQNLLMRDFNMIHNVPDNREWVVLFLETQTWLNQPRTILDFENKQLGFPYSLKKTLALQAVRYLVSDIPIADDDLTLIKKFPLPLDIDHLFYVSANGGTQTVRISTDSIYLYENSFYYPRAFFVGDYKVIEDDMEALKYVTGADFDPGKYVVLKKAINFNAVGKENNSEPQLIKDEQNFLEIDIENDQEGFLVVSDTYYPGWSAKVNGEEREILRANYGFRALLIKPGRNKVEMRFEPTYWDLGIKLSVVFASFVVVGFALSFAYSRREARNRITS